MVQGTSPIFENYTYNLSSVLSDEIITDTANWVCTYNQQMSGYAVVTLLILFGIILFTVMRKITPDNDTESAVYSGLISSFVGLMTFLISTDCGKIMSWGQYSIIILITSIAILVNYFNRRF